jgi:hypothetical protein
VTTAGETEAKLHGSQAACRQRLGQAMACSIVSRTMSGMQHRLTNHEWQCQSFFEFGAGSVYISMTRIRLYVGTWDSQGYDARLGLPWQTVGRAAGHCRQLREPSLSPLPSSSESSRSLPRAQLSFFFSLARPLARALTL